MPQHLDANGDFLACCTHLQRLRLWRVGGREAKPYGSGSRRLDLPAGLEVRAMQVNCTGSQVGTHLNAQTLKQAAEVSRGPGLLSGAETAGQGVSLHGQGGEGRRGRLSCWRVALPAVQWVEEIALQAQPLQCSQAGRLGHCVHAH